jgi:hypothetical protein
MAESKIVKAPVEAILERVVGIDGEVGGDHRQPRAVPNSSFEEIRYGSAPFAVKTLTY